MSSCLQRCFVRFVIPNGMNGAFVACLGASEGYCGQKERARFADSGLLDHLAFCFARLLFR